MAENDLSTRIEEVAEAPAAASNGTESVTNHKLGDLIEADRYLASKRAAANSKNPGFRIGTFKAGSPA